MEMTPEQLAALQARLPQPDTAGLDPEPAAARLNTPGTGAGTTWLDVPPGPIIRRLLIDAVPVQPTLSVWGLIELNSRRPPSTAFASAVSGTNAQDQMVSHMVALVRLLQFPLVEASDAETRVRFQAIFTALVNANWMHENTRTAAISLVSRPSAWSEDAPFLRAVTARDVGIALGAAP